jgi:signal peptide peptidase SppA
MLPRVASHIFNTPLLVHPGKAAAMMAGIGGRLVDGQVEIEGAAPLHHVAFAGAGPSLGVVGDRLGRAFDRTNRKPYDMVGSVAILPIEGTLVPKGSFVESSSGETSYEGIQTQVQRVRRDPAVRGVVFEVDSFGGSSSLAFETSDMIHQLSQEKPTIAILSEHAYSGGYLLAAACRSVIVPESGGVGSIGVITMHTDWSAAIERAGAKVTILKAGAHKADANPYEALGPDVAARIQDQLESLRQIFAGRVAKYRGQRLSFERAMATEALDYMGEAGVAAGLADAVGNPQETFQAFLSQLNRA